MQMHFYIMLGLDIKEIKKNAFRHMGEKLKLWKHKLKRKLHFQMSDIPAIVRAREGIILQ